MAYPKTYQWFRHPTNNPTVSATPISGATSLNYTSADVDLGLYLHLQETISGPFGSLSAISNVIGPVTDLVAVAPLVQRFKNTTDAFIASGEPNDWYVDTEPMLISGGYDVHVNADATKFYTMATLLDWNLGYQTPEEATNLVRILEHDVATGEVTIIDPTGSVPIIHDPSYGPPLGWFWDPYTDDIWIVCNVQTFYYPNVYLYCLRKANGWKCDTQPVIAPHAYESPPIFASPDYVMWEPFGYTDQGTGYRDFDVLWITRPTGPGPITTLKRQLSTDESAGSSPELVGMTAGAPDGTIYSFNHFRTSVGTSLYKKIAPGGQYQTIANLQTVGFPDWLATTNPIFHAYLGATRQTLMMARQGTFGIVPVYAYMDVATETFDYRGAFPQYFDAACAALPDATGAVYQLANPPRLYDTNNGPTTDQLRRNQYNISEAHTWIQINCTRIDNSQPFTFWAYVAWSDIGAFLKVITPADFGANAAAMSELLDFGDNPGDAIMDWAHNKVYTHTQKRFGGDVDFGDGMPVDPDANGHNYWDSTASYQSGGNWPMVSVRLDPPA